LFDFSLHTKRTLFIPIVSDFPLWLSTKFRVFPFATPHFGSFHIGQLPCRPNPQANGLLGWIYIICIVTTTK
jgi:hypothetical protein